MFLLLLPPCLAAWVCRADPSITEPPVSPGSDSTPSSRGPRSLGANSFPQLLVTRFPYTCRSSSDSQLNVTCPSCWGPD